MELTGQGVYPDYAVIRILEAKYSLKSQERKKNVENI
jgi:hypothetical protein